MPSSPHPDDQPGRLDDNTFSKRLKRRLSRAGAFGPREVWWRLLDALEARRALRRSLYAAGMGVILAVVISVWIYPLWRQRTAVSMARQWLEAGRLDHAAGSIQEALKVAPDDPDSWKLAADLARRLHQQDRALANSEHAALLVPGDIERVLAWAADALLAERPEETERALASLSSDDLARSAHAQRIAGELARRRHDLDAARVRFEAALRLDGPDTAIDEVPLGVILLSARDPALRRRGVALLEKWTSNLEWGANALRTLLQDAIARDDRPALLARAEALRAHPRCTLGDIPNCLLALSKSNEARFAEVLALMQKNHAGDPGNIALLTSWLNQIGRSREAYAWLQTLPPALARQPPAAVGAAESLRQLAEWPALLSWAHDANWGRDLESIRLAYSLLAARQLGETPLAKELWATLQSRAVTEGGGTIFTADTLYSWGLREEAVILLWTAADQPGVAVQALGTLARHYQVGNDAVGQYRAFKRLHSLRPKDAAMANNYAFFALLTGNDFRPAEQIAGENFKAHPDNIAYRATQALVLCIQNQPDQALTLMKAAKTDWKTTPAMALSYGLALAGTHQKTEARAVFSTLSPESLTPEEITLIQKPCDKP